MEVLASYKEMLVILRSRILPSIFSGALAFLLVWFFFLWMWSIPIILIEYGVGRFTRKGTTESFGKLLGPSYRFMGAFPAITGIFSG